MPAAALRAVLVLLVALPAIALAQPVGRVLLAAGDAFAVRDGKEVRLAFGAAIEFRDTLRTGAASSLQVRLIDDSFLSLRENTEFQIEEYRFGAAQQPEDERAFFRLVRGGFRAVTGLIGRSRNASYRVRTDTATIGIRGTDYAARQCVGSECGAGVRPGLYGTVVGLSSGTNQITLTNNAGEATFGINQHFYVPDQNSAPQPLLQPPSFVSIRPQGQPRGQQVAGTGGGTGSGSGGGTGGASGTTGTGTESTGASSGASAESRPSATTQVSVPTPILTQPFQQTEQLNSAGTSVALMPANGFVVAFPNPPGGFSVFFDDDLLAGVYNGLNQLTAFGTSNPSGSLGGGTISDTGSFTLGNGQVFTYGRWDGAASLINQSGTPVSGVPLLFGTASGVGGTNLNFGGVATYNYRVGPHPVDAAGNVGNVTSSAGTVDFTAGTMNLALGLHFPAVGTSGPATFTLSGSGTKSISPLTGDFQGSLSGACVGGGCASGASVGAFEAGFAGTTGYELMVVAGGIVSGATTGGPVVFLNTYDATSFTPGVAPGGVHGVAAYSDSGNPSGSQPTVISSILESGGVLNSYGNGASFPSGSRNTAGAVDTGFTGLADGGYLAWGRWQNGGGATVVPAVGGTYSPASGVTWAFGPTPTAMPSSGTFTFNLLSPTTTVASTAGTLGTVTGGQFSVTFGPSNSLSVVSPLNMSNGALNFSLNCAGVCTTFTGPTTPLFNMTGTCSGGACATSAPASALAVGVLVGPQAKGLAISGNVSSTALPVGNAVSFVAPFARP